MEKTITLPEGISAEKKGSSLVVTGPKGTLAREFTVPGVTWKLKESTITVTSATERRRTLALTGTVAAHMRNMVTGVQHGYQATLKVVYSHFPMKLKIEGQELVIENFMGARAARRVAIPEGVDAKVSKDEIILTGTDKELVGQAAGRIETKAKVTGFDRRVFQDGLHLVAKAHPQEEN